MIMRTIKIILVILGLVIGALLLFATILLSPLIYIVFGVTLETMLERFVAPITFGATKWDISKKD